MLILIQWYLNHILGLSNVVCGWFKESIICSITARHLAVIGYYTSGHWSRKFDFDFQGSCPACKRRFVGYRNQVIRCMNCQNIVWQPNSGSSGGAGRSRSSGPDVIDVEFEEKWWTCMLFFHFTRLIRGCKKMRRQFSGLGSVSRFVCAAVFCLAVLYIIRSLPDDDALLGTYIIVCCGSKQLYCNL
jgi:hypothetical protein